MFFGTPGSMFGPCNNTHYHDGPSGKYTQRCSRPRRRQVKQLMRFRSASLLVCAVFLAGVNAASVLVHPDQINTSKAAVENVRAVPHSPITRNSVSSNRLLRSNDASTDSAGMDKEERAGGTGIASKLDDLMQKMFMSSSSTERAVIKKWLESQVHPKELFGGLRLGSGAAKLDDPNLAQWLRLVVAYRAKHGPQSFSDLDVYYLLLRKVGAKDVTTMIQSLKKTSGFKKFATSMENSLSGSWINQNIELNTDPKTLFNMLRLEEAGNKLDETPIFHQWLNYVDMYRTKKGSHWFEDNEMLDLFRKTMPEEDMVTLVHLLRQVPRMKKHADTMQISIFITSKSSHKFMTDVWLQSQERPVEVFKILRLAGAELGAFDNNAMLIQWLRYTKIYRDKIKDGALSEVQTVRFLKRERPMQSDWEFAALFQSLKKIPDLERQAENMQTYLFQQWLSKFDPKRVASMLAIPFSINVVRLEKSDPLYMTCEAYTLYYAKHHGGEALLKKVRAAFANNNPSGALAAAVKFG